ncbi:hypothetical protein DY000_02009174 [Brassica cretica]|uniref:Uncharacterized protein n=1 Tax=Brassica cretica TaxID=69181 RepID=A0ABQ7C2Y5_BRACR|nr:hypothetical protein DY000_02009174 [Brassica cretica]
MIEDIVTDVSNKLNLSAPSSDFVSLVGMESKMKEMRRLLQLDSDEVRKIGIWGPPGIGNVRARLDRGTTKMPKLLVRLGRQIVRKESVSEPGKRQFLNDANDGEGGSSGIGIDLEWNKDIT